MTDHLTVVDPAFERHRRATYAGMASWAMTGPAGTTCRECLHWNGCGKDTGYVATWRTLKARPCAKYRSLMNNKTGAAVPHDAPSCRFFQANPNPPAIYAK
jgi:hypothetical protein